jgi:hypothetical protein
MPSCQRPRDSPGTPLNHFRCVRPHEQVVAGSACSVRILWDVSVAVRVGYHELRAWLASHLESATPIEVTRDGRTVGLNVVFPQAVGLSGPEQLLQAELHRLCLGENELAADFQAWRRRRQQPQP